MKRGDSVMYVPGKGEEPVVGLVHKVLGSGNLNIQTPNGVETDIPHSEPSGADDEDLGRTWHEC